MLSRGNRVSGVVIWGTLLRIDLNTPLALRTSFAFPLQNRTSRREIAVGALWLLVPLIGWLLNMGHRIMFVHNMIHSRPAWPAWRDYSALLVHGSVTFAGMLFYYSPAFLCVAGYFCTQHLVFQIGAAVCFVAATIAIPGYMSHYCISFDRSEIFDPRKALSRVIQCGSAYWHAWLIALLALACSFFGLLAIGVGFLFTSVWFWQVAGFSFATVMSQRHVLTEDSK